ncbi:hypothetical protein BDEG_24484 [Batrachochytrium dendrobatidis JEL423]|uniref:Uncharacterized protein n=1 Tax=Batrachochytrium dendrobatidis (strain JEL423) TaxID=403673 RepID=A0A177WL14_BATDL|nr:hypothetical protein BDEG_24484 [Batrachochytrium dendrobatidis JEL423]
MTFVAARVMSGGATHTTAITPFHSTIRCDANRIIQYSSDNIFGIPNNHYLCLAMDDSGHLLDLHDHIDTNDKHGITLIDVCHKLVCKVLQTHIDGSWISTNSSLLSMVDFKPNKCVVQMQHTQFPWSQHFDSELPIDMMLHEQQIRRVQHYKYLGVVLHEPLYHTMRLEYNQVAVSNTMLVVSDSCKPPTHNQLSDTNMFGSHSSNGHVCTGSDW